MTQLHLMKWLVINMPQFHETGYGKRFFDSQLPQLIKQLESIAVELKRMNDSKLIVNNVSLQDEVVLIDYIKAQVLNELMNDD